MRKLSILGAVLAIAVLAVAQSFRPSGDGHLKPLSDMTTDIGGPLERWRTNYAGHGYFRSDNDQVVIDTQTGGQRAAIRFKVEGTNVGGFFVRNGEADTIYLGGYGEDITTNAFLRIEQDGDVFVNKGRLYTTNGGLHIRGKLTLPHTETQTLLPTDQISYTAGTVVVVQGSGGLARTLISTPTIPAGQDGDIIFLTGDSATATVTIQDESIHPGSLLRLQSTNRVLALYKRVTMMYSGNHGAWEELAPPASGGGGGVGDVTAASAFGADNKVILSDGAGTKGVKSSVINVDALGNITGVNNITMTNPFPTGVYATNHFTNSNRLLRSEGSNNRQAKSSNIQLDDNGTINIVAGAPLAYPQNTMQSFNPGSVSAGMNVGSYNGIPSSVINGGIWFYTAKQCLYAFYASSSSQYAISPRDEINLDLRNFKASGGPAPVFDQSEDTDKWTFVDAQTSVIQCQFPIGHSWGATAGVYLMFSMDTANSGNVVFALQTMQSFLSSAEAVNGSGYTAAVNLTAAPAPTLLGGLGLASGSMPMDGVTGPGSAVLFKFRIQRRGADAGDTALGDVKLHAVRVDWVRSN